MRLRVKEYMLPLSVKLRRAREEKEAELRTEHKERPLAKLKDVWPTMTFKKKERK